MIVGNITVKAMLVNGAQVMNKNYYDDDYPPTNRDRKLSPKRGNTYCGGCDRELVPDGSKCTICGWRNGKRRLKR